VADQALVAPLSVEPAVLDVDSEEEWRAATGAFGVLSDESDQLVLAADGPPGWQRTGVDALPAMVARPVDAVAVSDVSAGDETISFSVDRTGVPVLVRTSYHPNWTVDGAEGPYRVSPNLIAVVPTQAEVTLHYGRSVTDWVGLVLLLVGVGGAVALWRAGPLAIEDDEYETWFDDGAGAADASPYGPQVEGVVDDSTTSPTSR
jgi:hypothetical protein